MENLNLSEMFENLQEIRIFCRHQSKRLKRGTILSSQMLDILSRIVLSDSPLTPLKLSEMTGLSKSSVSRLIENLEKNELIKKHYSSKDKRSYTLISTEKGNNELERAFRYYLEPVCELKKILDEERYSTLITIIKEVNYTMQNRKEKP